MNRTIHPTLKKCKCGFIGTRNHYYKHCDAIKRAEGTLDMTKHGETVLWTDDPLLSFPSLLQSAENERRVVLNNSNALQITPTDPVANYRV